jgi:outer membrane protein TolC
VNTTHLQVIRGMAAAAVLFTGALLAPELSAQARSLSPEDVVKAALAGDARVESANWDWLAAQAKAREADLRRLPSVSLSAGYTRLSDLQYTIKFGPVSVPVDSLDDAYSLGINLQYPVFAGFRLLESAQLAQVQAQGKEIAAEMIKRSLVFEAQRAYWEAQRASNNVTMLRENLALAEQSQEIVKQQLDQGTALRVDMLAAKVRADQATMDLGAAVNAEKRAFWNLAYLVDGTAAGGPSSQGSGDSADTAADPAVPYLLAVKPQPVTDDRFPTLDATQLISRALANRPEIRASSLTTAAAEIGRRLAEAPLYPTLAVTWSYLYADPNQRVAFQTDPWQFTGTWSLGVSLSYDVGGLPATLASREAQVDSALKSRADEKRQKEVVVLDVENCLLAFQEARSDYALIAGMIEQAQESERVASQRRAAGTASDLDVLSARTARLRIEFSIANKQIDEQIAAADLERAAALADVR